MQSAIEVYTHLRDWTMVFAATPQYDGFLPVLTITSDSYRDVFAFWESSLDGLSYPRSRRSVVYLDELNPPPGYCTASWALAAERRLQEVVNYIATHLGQKVLLTSNDTQFFPSFLNVQHRWLQTIESNSLDMFFMREQGQQQQDWREGEVSTNFVVINCTEKALRFWQQVLANQIAEPRMAGHKPLTIQYHTNQLLVYRQCVGPQDGDFSVQWDFIPNEDGVWSEPLPSQDLGVVAFHVALDTMDKCELLHRVRKLIHAHQRTSILDGSNDLAHVQLPAATEIDRVASEIAQLRKELTCASPAQWERYRHALAMASTELLAEVKALAACMQPAVVQQTIGPELAGALPGTFELVD